MRLRSSAETNNFSQTAKINCPIFPCLETCNENFTNCIIHLGLELHYYRKRISSTFPRKTYIANLGSMTWLRRASPHLKYTPEFPLNFPGKPRNICEKNSKKPIKEKFDFPVGEYRLYTQALPPNLQIFPTPLVGKHAPSPTCCAIMRTA